MAEHDITAQINVIISGYKKEVQEASEREARTVAKECADKLKATSPKNKGDYARGWSVKKNGKGYVVYNKTNWQLTHLLERSHLIANQAGKYGRTAAQPHIAPVEKWGNQEYESRLKEILNK